MGVDKGRRLGFDDETGFTDAPEQLKKMKRILEGRGFTVRVGG
jgi:hypothetical protein